MSIRKASRYGLVPVCAVCLLIATEIGHAQDNKNSRQTRPPITIDLEKKYPSSKREAAVDTESHLKSFEDLKDPFEGEIKNLPELKDPFERYNRSMYRFNDTLVEYVLSPAARGYRWMVPEDGRLAIRNILSNAASPVSLLSSLAQGEMSKSATILGRLMINTTLGVGGIFDVAQNYYGIKPVNKDFDQALESYGVPAGPYLVLPIFGPSTMRHTVGRVVDSLANPTTYFAPLTANVGAGAGGTVSEYSFNPDLKKDLDQSSVDPYESVRYFYYQRRGLRE